MPTLYAIAAMSENRSIGLRGKIPWHLPADFAWFKHKTMGGTLIMGRRTFRSIGTPLQGRQTVVLSRDSVLKDVTTVADARQLETALKSLPQPYWVCGGSDIYRQFLRQCDLLYLTRVKKVIVGDTFFPPFEDKFELDQVIHENDDFRVERWRRLNLNKPPFEQEAWPVATGASGATQWGARVIDPSSGLKFSRYSREK